ncbi:MAG: M23 family metallopeptidase [Treponema sp.]|jgi:hypothetical protein|nr:M23 family metallopeptidase [Treponema sp.]
MKKQSKKRWALLCLGIIMEIAPGIVPPQSRALLAMDWPQAAAAISANFGANDRGLPCLFTVFESEDPVRASGEGELIFMSAPGGASRIPSPLGAWMALDHGDGLISIYGHLENPSPVPVPNHPEQGRVIAAAGQSGWSNRKGFSFALFDRKERRWINPSMILSHLPDTMAPVFHSAELIDSEGRVFNLGTAKNISQGRYTLFVHASDTMLTAQEPQIAPYSILYSVNGQEAGELAFGTYSARDGALMTPRNGLVSVRQVYGRYPSFEAGELWFTRGQSILEIIVMDISGNSRNAVFRLQVD